MSTSGSSRRPYYKRQRLFQGCVLTAMLAFVIWSLLSMKQADEEKFQLEALSRCRVLEVAIADILHRNVAEQATLVQQRIDKLVRSDPRIVRLSVIAKTDIDEYTHIASSLLSRIGKPAHEEDLDAFSSGEIVYLDEEYQDVGALDITYPVHDFEGGIVALLGYTVSREADFHVFTVRSSLGLLAMCLLLFYLWQSRVIYRQHHAFQEGLLQQLKSEESLRVMGEKLHNAKKMEAIGLLAGGVAHDLNNMLTGIVGYPDLMLQDDNLTASQRKRLKTIRETAIRIADVVSDMQVLSRSSAANLEVVDLNWLVEEFLLSPEFAVKHKDFPVRLETDLELCLPAVCGKRHHLRKVIMNLLVNALEASGPQGQINIHTSAQTLTDPLDGYETIPAGSYVKMRISDTGSGINPEIIGRIFEPFFSRKVMGSSGTGLGLAICWSIVHDHDGYIDLVSNNRGTTFDIYLPASAQNVDQLSCEFMPLTLLQGGGESVLIVDDEPVPRQVIGGMLRSLGYQVLEAQSGETAVAMLSQRKVDLLLLDMLMDPGINGLETYRRILALHPGQKALILSGQARAEDVDDALRLGAGNFLMKPLNLQRLATAVFHELKRESGSGKLLD